jgi:hypothetical protein
MPESPRRTALNGFENSVRDIFARIVVPEGNRVGLHAPA